ncbi:trk system potassium uptake protein TrkA [Algoriphagus boseongensis]|uniref:Trk system potassium uptake protein TrkA n=1 Tax=Algoriphagus boseongensis TaxID=1442587 RepID=A0A4R6T892_9BACT|nr:TrkA family potassium uptake protein [Algoriphagus boseongensis]TDQ19210.1 trk system potassium uptake protein TrkA [Algoriphagus boseongensis]
MKYIIVGMGNFGGFLASRLTELGHEVIGVDSSEVKIDQVKDKITHAIIMDATDTETVKTLPYKDTDAVIIAIGENVGASIMVTAIFKQLNVKRLISRSINDVHETVIKAIGVSEIVHPEEDSAERMAKRLQMRNVLDSLDLSDDYNVIEVKCPSRYIGMTLIETNLRKEYQVSVITIIRELERTNMFGNKSTIRKVAGVVTGETRIQEGDILVLFGLAKDIETILAM